MILTKYQKILKRKKMEQELYVEMPINYANLPKWMKKEAPKMLLGENWDVTKAEPLKDLKKTIDCHFKLSEGFNDFTSRIIKKLDEDEDEWFVIN